MDDPVLRLVYGHAPAAADRPGMRQHEAAAAPGQRFPHLDRAARRDFERLVLPHLDAMYNLAHWLTRDQRAATELVQDAIQRALPDLPSLHAERARGWLLRIVHTAHRDTIARRRSLPTAPPARSRERNPLNAALAGLPTELRECLVLRELEEMSYNEIALIAGVPIGTVMSRLARARRMLMERSNANHPVSIPTL